MQVTTEISAYGTGKKMKEEQSTLSIMALDKSHHFFISGAKK